VYKSQEVDVSLLRGEKKSSSRGSPEWQKKLPATKKKDILQNYEKVSEGRSVLEKRTLFKIHPHRIFLRHQKKKEGNSRSPKPLNTPE